MELANQCGRLVHSEPAGSTSFLYGESSKDTKNSSRCLQFHGFAGHSYGLLSFRQTNVMVWITIGGSENHPQMVFFVHSSYNLHRNLRMIYPKLIALISSKNRRFRGMNPSTGWLNSGGFHSSWKIQKQKRMRTGGKPILRNLHMISGSCVQWPASPVTSGCFMPSSAALGKVSRTIYVARWL